MNWTLVFICLTTVFVLIPLANIIKISSVKLFDGSFKRVERDDFPEEHVSALLSSEIFLRKNGFEFQYLVKRDPVINGQEWGAYGALYIHGTMGTSALVYVEPTKSPFFDSRIAYVSKDASSKYFVTNSGSEFAEFYSSGVYEVVDAMTISKKKHLDTHAQRVSSLSLAHVDADEAIESHSDTFFNQLVKDGVLVEWNDGFRLPFLSAAKVFFRTKKMAAELKKEKSELEKSGDFVEATRIESPKSQVSAYNSHKNIQESNKFGWALKAGILLVSVLAFGLSFGFLDLSIDTLLILITVLFVHEAGHLLGMFIFGYKDLHMLFIPFMGALASGKKEQVSSIQEAVILLLGPLPGYFLGIAILVSQNESTPSWVVVYANMSLILNVINLLPFMPLDGGRIINLALFNRFPSFQLGFSVFSILILGLVGLSWGEPAGVIIAIVLIIALPFTIKEIKLLKHLLGKGLHKEGIDNLKLISSLNDHAVWAKEIPATKWQLLDSLKFRVQHANTGIAASIFIFFMWFMTIFSPLPLVALSDNFLAAAAAMALDDSEWSSAGLIKKYEAAETDSERALLAIQISSMLGYEEKPGADEYWAIAESLMANGDMTNAERASAYYTVAAQCYERESDCTKEYLLESIRLYGSGEENPERLYRALITLAGKEVESISNEERLKYLNEALEVIKPLDEQGFYEAEVNSSKSRVHEKSGDVGSAEKLLVANLLLYQEEDEFALSHTRSELVALYARNGMALKAIEIVKSWEASSKRVYEGGLREQYSYWLVWLLFDTDAEEALKYLQKLAGNSPASSLEANLGEFLLSTSLGLEPANSLEEIAQLSSQIEEEEWYRFIPWVSKYNDSVSDVDSYGFSKAWYMSMRRMLDTPEFSFIMDRVNEYDAED